MVPLSLLPSTYPQYLSVTQGTEITINQPGTVYKVDKCMTLELYVRRTSFF